MQMPLHQTLSTDRVARLRLALVMEEHKIRVGQRIRAAREAHGWSQAQLAREVESTLDGPSISRYERGQVMPRPAMLDSLANALGVDTAYFLVPDPPPDAPTGDLMEALRSPSDQKLAELQEQITGLRDAVLALVADNQQLRTELQALAASDRRPRRKANGS